MSSLLSLLEARADAATDEVERSVYRAQWAGAVARLGDVSKARTEIRRLRSINATYSPMVTAWILLAEGLADHFESLSVTALDRFKRAHGLAIAFGNPEVKSLASAWIGASEFVIGNYEAAAIRALEAIQDAPPSKGALALSRAYLVLANIQYVTGVYQDAPPLYSRARTYAIEAHDISMQSAVLYNVAAFRIARLSLQDAFGQPTVDELLAAELELNSITNLDSGLQVNSLTAMIPILRGQLMLIKREWAEADQSYSEAIPAAATYGALRWEPRFLAEQAQCKAELGLREHACDLAGKAVAQLTDRMDFDDLAASHARLALCLSSLGNSSDAASHLTTARQCLAQFLARQEEHRRKIAPLIPGV